MSTLDMTKAIVKWLRTEVLLTRPMKKKKPRHKARLPTLDRTIPPKPRAGFTGAIVPGFRQTDYYSCGAVAAYTVLVLRFLHKRTRPCPSYAAIYDAVAPTAEYGAAFCQVRRVLRGCKSFYGRFRRRTVIKQLREGHVVIVAIAIPNTTPVLMHYVTLTAASTTGYFLALNYGRSKVRAWRWVHWESLRPGGWDKTLVVKL